MTTYRYSITGGPSKWDLMLALFDNENQKRLPFFEAMGGRSFFKMKVLIHSVTRNSPDMWEIHAIDMDNHEMVKIAYSTETRTGWVNNVVEVDKDPLSQVPDRAMHNIS
ncbi:MAG: hypothetical protein ABIH67_05385 [Candidatus Uhrbacteria bacterium]